MFVARKIPKRYLCGLPGMRTQRPLSTGKFLEKATNTKLCVAHSAASARVCASSVHAFNT